MKSLALSIALGIFLSAGCFGQQSILRQLIDLPSPPPEMPKEADSNGRVSRPEEFYRPENVPADNAPIRDLLDFWIRRANLSRDDGAKISMSEAAASRILDEYERDPEDLSMMLNSLPVTTETTRRVKEIYETERLAADTSEGWMKDVKHWLKFKTDAYLEELIEEATKARDDTDFTGVKGKEALVALARFDWPAAEIILKGLKSDTGNPRTSALAVKLLYENAVRSGAGAEAERLREELKEIALDKDQPGHARDSALDALLGGETWSGRDDWYLSLLEDETLLHLSDGIYGFSPLDTLPTKDPEKWTPILAELVTRGAGPVTNAAAQILIEIDTAESIKPLIPWLSDPGWAKIDWSPGGRTTLIQAVSKFDLRESIPGLIWIVQNEDDNVSWAARSLAEFGDPAAGPALRNALSRIGNETDRADIVNALIKCNVLSASEQVAAIEAYATAISTPEGRDGVESRGYWDEEDPLPVAVSIGSFLARRGEPDEETIRLLIDRQKSIRRLNPAISGIISDILQRWSGRLVDLETLNSIAEDKADLETIVGALARRKELMKSVPNDVYALVTYTGAVGRGLAPCIAGDIGLLANTLSSENEHTKAAVLACARLLRLELPIAEAKLLLEHKNKLLALAAERYLESVDTPESRKILYEKHKGKAIILGARDSFNPAKITNVPSTLSRLFSSVADGYSSRLHPSASRYGELDRFEEDLRKEILGNDDLVEIYSFVPSHVVRVYKDRATVTWYEDEARYYRRVVSKEELKEFKGFLVEADFENSPPVFGYCHHNCGMMEFVRISREGGRRLFGYSNYARFLGYQFAIHNLVKPSEAKLRYYLEDKLEGLEVLSSDTRYQPWAVWNDGDDLRVLFADLEMEEQIRARISEEDDLDDKNEELGYELKQQRRRERRARSEYEHFQWFEFRDGQRGRIAEEPFEVPFLSNSSNFEFGTELRCGPNTIDTVTAGLMLCAGDYSEYGLWLVDPRGPSRVAEGWMADPVAAPGGNWAIASKTDSNWADKNYVVRVDLRNKKSYRLQIPPGDNLRAVSYVESHRKILVCNSDDEGDRSECYLADPASGAVRRVKGEFRPLIHQTFRRLQRSSKPGEFWAAIAEGDSTKIGLYNDRTFSFSEVMAIPGISLDSMDIWVDETGSKLYFMYGVSYYGRSQLLSLPLPKDPIPKAGAGSSQ
ncbi:MAG: HEAT repeat domain-containing protein [Aridibacter famidurans]|nr:HEAT repeat domain-containing protein [Aridibacter famidurans]